MKRTLITLLILAAITLALYMLLWQCPGYAVPKLYCGPDLFGEV